MDIVLESVIKAPVLFSNMMMAKPRKEKEEMNTNKVYQHLSDHNYINPTNMKHNLSPKQLKKQLIITDLKAIYNCTMCGYRSMSRDVLFKHICTKKPKHTQKICKKIPKGYEKCMKCNYFAKSRANLIIHMKSHIECLKKQCTDCSMVKANIDAVFQCPNCNYSTKNPTSLKIHMHIHTRGTPYKCTECNFSGQDLKELINHYDEVKDLHCECGYVTHLKRQMTSHLRSHTQEKPFCCGVCSFATTDRAGLHRHMKNKHIID